MTSIIEETVKKRTRARKTTPAVNVLLNKTKTVEEEKTLLAVADGLTTLISQIEQAKIKIDNSQKEIQETKLVWEKEKKEQEKEMIIRKTEEDLVRKREEEEYQYQKMMSRKKAEDEFSEKKEKWEKELLLKKEEIEADKKELLQLREEAIDFEAELGKAIKEAQLTLQKELDAKFSMERKLREQEVKAEKEILVLKITSLTAENSRQQAEIEGLKKAVSEATAQVKDIAVKVIESRTLEAPALNSE